ncbi:QRFP-like peptide receptor [Ruditapes philippinarum]|uniref:QRFP-like peptide receptor n=1 Tax=Ruditapes philippinarum TaxID=129788 RepID=UPI00295C22AB|nr:QRFP-like peptide receptor [Ruditapes philippinarum]
MRTPTNYFISSLAVADLLVLLICQPAALMEFFAKDRWLIGKTLCKLVPLMENGVLHVSILTMLAVTFERYNALCHPFKHRMASTISATVKTIIGIWIIGTILTLPFLIMTEHEDAMFYDGSPIKVCRTKVNEMWRYCYTIFLFIAFFVLPFFILIGFYARIIKQLMSDKLKSLAQNDRPAVNALRSRRQVVQMLIFIIVLFFVTLFPIRVFSLWLIFTPTEDAIKIGLEAYLNLISWARILMYINSAGNPIIYSLTSTKFKTAFKRVLRRNRRYPQCGVASTRYSFKRTTPDGTDERRVPVQIRDERINLSKNEIPWLVVRLVLVPEKSKRRHRNGQSSSDFTPLQIMSAKIEINERDISHQ